MVEFGRPDPDDINLTDIAHALSMQCRYNGHTDRFYSVAEHCVHLTQHLVNCDYDKETQKLMLLHDAAEAYVGDIVYHLKPLITGFKDVEDRISAAIFKHFGVEPTDEQWETVHFFDRCICIDEMYHLCEKIDGAIFKIPDAAPLKIIPECWNPEEAKIKFLEEADRLEISTINK